MKSQCNLEEGGNRDSLNIIWGVSKYSWMIHDDFHEVKKNMIFFPGHGAKHSPPGGRGPPDCPGPLPPVRVPGPPLTNDISSSSPSNERFSTCIIIILDALSDGINPIS